MRWTAEHGILFESSKAEEFLKLFSPPERGIKLKVVTVIDPPFISTAFHYYNANNKKQCEFGTSCHIPKRQVNVTSWSTTCCIGYAIDLLQLLAHDLNFAPDLYEGKKNYDTIPCSIL